jgi:hypothetical protein
MSVNHVRQRKKRLRIAWSFLVMAAASGCTPGTVYSLYNHTDTELNLIFGEYTLNIPSGEVADIPTYPFRKSKPNSQDHLYYLTSASGSKWSYRLSFGPFGRFYANGKELLLEDKYNRGNINPMKYMFQLQPNGTLCPVQRGVAPPIRELTGCIEPAAEKSDA